MKKADRKPIIFAYGFDAAGFVTPSEPVEASDYTIRFFDYGSNQSLGEADGIVLPSGIFETIKTHTGYSGTSRWVVCDKDLLAKREKELQQNFQKGRWTVFLLRSVENDVGRDSDLAKRFLNGLFYRVESHDPNPHVHCMADEFVDYLHAFGINRTTFGNPRDGIKPRVLAGDRLRMVAAEVLGRLFFLPLPAINKGQTEVVSLVTKCVDAILEYKRRNELYLPDWVEAIEFRSERRLSDEVRTLEEQILQKREDLSKWRRYKGILSASGKPLNALVVEVFRDFFGLDLHSDEEFVEDAIIYGADGKPLFVVEIKGVNGGLKRDHVNQVDSHRERLNLTADVAGLLVLNDFTDIDGLAERKAKTFDALHVDHAERLNIKILRTTTLMEIIRFFEDDTQRGKALLKLCADAKPLVALSTGQLCGERAGDSQSECIRLPGSDNQIVPKPHCDVLPNLV